MRVIVLTIIYVMGETLITNEPKMMLMLGIITNCFYACWSNIPKNKKEKEQKMEDVREVEMEVKEILPGLELIVAKNFEKKYLNLETVFRNGADIIEYAAKTDIENAGAFHKYLQNYITGTKSKEINEKKYIIEGRIKKLETIPDMIKEMIELDKNILQVLNDAIKKTK